MDSLTLCKSQPLLSADAFFPPSGHISEGLISGSLCCLFSKWLDQFALSNWKSSIVLFFYLSILLRSSSSRQDVSKTMYFSGWRCFGKCLLVAQGSVLLPPLLTLSPRVPGHAVIILSLAMNSELYMMLQAGQSPGHWTHLDYEDATIWMSRPCAVFYFLFFFDLMKMKLRFNNVGVPVHAPPTFHAGSAVLELVSPMGSGLW